MQGASEDMCCGQAEEAEVYVHVFMQAYCGLSKCMGACVHELEG